MNAKDARAFIDSISAPPTFEEETAGQGTRWQNPQHLATDQFTAQAIGELTPPGQGGGYALVEIWLTAPVPGAEAFAGIIAVDSRGIWSYDGDGSVDDETWRPCLIPWAFVRGVRLHRES